MNVLAELRSRFEVALKSLTDNPARYAEMVKPAQDLRFGDFQANCAMPLANERKTKPRELASQIVSRLDVSDLCHEPEVAGPGFINLKVKDDWIEETINRLISDERLGHQPTQLRRQYVIDYSGPNIAKPMHVGHLRSTVIGDALCRILRFIGHDVIGDNHIGDWGTQFGMIIYGYKHFLDRGAFDKGGVAELARLYRLVNQISDYHDINSALPELKQQQAKQRECLESVEAATDPNDKQAHKSVKKMRAHFSQLSERIDEYEKRRDIVNNDLPLKTLADTHPHIVAAARNETAKLHAGDEDSRQLWEQFIPKCRAALDVIYNRLGITIDRVLGESFYQSMLADVVQDMLSKGIASESEGAVCVFVEGNEAPFIVRKTDGAFTYATTDLATIKYRHEQFQADSLLYVVDARQSEHFRLLFTTARRWGFNQAEYRHVSFGTILGNDKKPFKTRSGDIVGLESLLDEAIARARQIVEENDDAKLGGPELDEPTRAKVAETVGIGGIKYADLRHNRDSDYVFSWEKMLETNGDTATYIQYAYARIGGILRKGNVNRNALCSSSGSIRISVPQERELSLQLLRFPEAIDDAAVDCRPNILTQYLFETANSFSAFHRDCPVLKADSESARISRLLLCDLTARILSVGLALLGIQTCEQM